MTVKPISALLLAATLSLVSCKKEETKEESADNKKPVPSVYEIVNGTNIPKQPAQTTQNMSVTPGQTVTTVTPPQQSAPVTIAKGMNPPHGQPGHRCDIKVGAPLNSPAAKPATPQGSATVTKMNNSSFTVTPASTPASGTTSTTNSGVPALLSTPAIETAPGMNPPHGQEGHRCDIAVGAPLPK